MKERIEILPKTELHCHLDGSLSLKAIRRLADLANIELPAKDEDLTQLVTAPQAVQDLTDYLKTFDFIRPLLQTTEALRLAAYDVAEQMAADGVIYGEIRFAPELSMDKGLTAVEVVEAVLDGLAAAEQDFDIVVRALVCGMRSADQSLVKSIFKAVAHLAPKGLVGFDFAGDEANNPTSILADTIREIQELGLPFTLHAGECNCPQNLSDGLDLGIKRFGHSTALYKDDALMDRAIAEGATFELCLTSNLHTKAIPHLRDWPYPKLYAKGGQITINTDNRTVSTTNLNKEYQLLHEHYGTTLEDFQTFNEHAIRASFVTEEEKALLLEKLRQGYARVLK